MSISFLQHLVPYREGMDFAFRSLHSRNYRFYFIGNGISLFGTWMQRMATSWLVYRLTGSAILLGTIEFASQFSSFLLMPFAGVLLDGMDLRGFLRLTQVFALIQASLLAGLTIVGWINFPLLVLLSIFLGLINAFDMPGRHAFTARLVSGKAELANAVALNSSLFNSARLIGPALAGLTVAAIGEGACFLLNALSFIPFILLLDRITVSGSPPSERKPPFWTGFKEGLAYAWAHDTIRPLLILLAVNSFVGTPFVVLMPFFAGEVLHGGAQTLGFLMGAVGLGALVAALSLAARRDTEGLERLAPLSFALFGAGLVAFAWSRFFALSMLLQVFNGYWMISGWASANTVLQTSTDDDKRARIMSLYTMVFMGMAPLGSLLAGFMAQHLGPVVTLTITGTCCLCVSALFAVFQQPTLHGGAEHVDTHPAVV